MKFLWLVVFLFPGNKKVKYQRRRTGCNKVLVKKERGGTPEVIMYVYHLTSPLVHDIGLIIVTNLFQIIGDSIGGIA